MEIILILSFFFLFLIAGALCVYGVYSFIVKKRTRAVWSIALAFFLVLVYVIFMFLLE